MKKYKLFREFYEEEKILSCSYDFGPGVFQGFLISGLKEDEVYKITDPLECIYSFLACERMASVEVAIENPRIGFTIELISDDILKLNLGMGAFRGRFKLLYNGTDWQIVIPKD